MHSVLVANDITQDCLVGVDFLAKYKCLIDFEARVVKASGVNVPIICKGSGSVECGRISLVKTVTVPGYREMPARIGSVSDKVTGIVELAQSWICR